MNPGASADTRPRVAVCVATFRRPELLAELLDSLGRQTFRRMTPWVRVVVVDNDDAGSARAVVDAARPRFPFELEYAVQPERNISLARNLGVSRARTWGAEWVAFVDDDEVARPEWLDALLEVQSRFAADVVAGEVVACLPEPAPGWARRSGVFGVANAGDGAPVPFPATNNALVTTRLLEAAGGPFDPAFGISGGGDSLFFLRCAREGARMVAAAGAVTEERYPPARVRLGWVLRRAFRNGNAAVFCERALPPAQRRLPVRVAKAAGRTVAAAVLLPFSPLFGSAVVVRTLWSLWYGAGCAAALTGYRFHEYRDPAP